MAESSRGIKFLIAALAAAVLVLGSALVMVLVRDRGSAASPPARDRDMQAPDQRRQGGFGRAKPGLGAPARPPSRPRNNLGQPLNEDGRPIGPSEKLAGIRNKPIAPGEVPLIPPRFDDTEQRARFKRWWVDEIGRRVAIYTDLEPGPDYPTAEQTAAMLDEFYDAAEPRGPDESVEQAYARRQTWHRLWQQFLDTYGATVYTVVSRGGDPQYGDPPPPPIQPGQEDSAHEIDAAPAPPATDMPPGRDPGQPPPATR